MFNRRLRARMALAAALLLGIAGAQSNPALREIADAGRLVDLRWPDFTDYRLHVQNFYAPTGYVPAWVQNGQPTRQALGVIAILQQAGDKGLSAEDYDGSLWAGRLARLQGTSSSPSGSDLAHFD